MRIRARIPTVSPAGLARLDEPVSGPCTWNGGSDRQKVLG